jgi:hypothetical protein
MKNPLRRLFAPMRERRRIKRRLKTYVGPRPAKRRRKKR